MNEALIASLQAQLRDAMSVAVPEQERDYLIVDFPNYDNIGDSAIYLGEEILLREHFGRAPLFVTEADDAAMVTIENSLRSAMVFLQGGGNFGDIYPRHQLFREAVVARNPHRKIVQLPQTIRYNDPAMLARTAAIYNAHPDLTLMVRDTKSLKIAQDAFSCAVMLVPDMAFMIGSVALKRANRAKLFCLMREDVESGISDPARIAEAFPDAVIADWPVEVESWTLASRVKRKIARVRARVLNDAGSPAFYNRLATRRVDTGLEMLDRGEVILTDRLHAHILSILLGKPHVIIDNNYGKLASFLAAWTADGSGELAANVEEAIELARVLTR